MSTLVALMVPLNVALKSSVLNIDYKIVTIALKLMLMINELII